MQAAQVERARTGMRGGEGLRAFIVFTGSGPILLLTSYREPTDPRLISKLRDKGIGKFIAYEVAVGDVGRIYGQPFDVIAADLERSEDARVLDFNGHNIFSSFSFSDLGRAIKWGDSPPFRDQP